MKRGLPLLFVLHILAAALFAVSMGASTNQPLGVQHAQRDCGDYCRYLGVYAIELARPKMLERLCSFSLANATARISDDGNVVIKGGELSFSGTDSLKFTSAKLIVKSGNVVGLTFTVDELYDGDTVSYRFEGKFLDPPENPDGQYIFVDLKGVITQSINGKRYAGGEISFTRLGRL